MAAKRIIITLLFFLFCFISALPGQSICHAGLALEGQFMKNGEKLKTEQPLKMTVRIFDDEFGGQLLFEENQDVAAGSEKTVFTFEQGDITIRQQASGMNTADLWVEVESDGQVMTPRLNLAEIDTVNNLTGESIQLRGASLRAGGTATLIIDNNGVTLGSLLNMGSQSIILGGVSHNTWPTGGSSADARIAALENRIAALETLLKHFKRDGDEITISGANLHIVNGTGSTDGTVNGKGNLVIGYNEKRGSDDNRSGSHNLVIGALQNYSSYGGLVAGYTNTISAPWASVSGGWKNEASNQYSSVSGGESNKASGNLSSVSGGISNTASGKYASVSGGRNNKASGDFSFVGGGGGKNDADGNKAFAVYSAILGGYSNVAGDYKLTDHNLGQNTCVSGGFGNVATGEYASISGGRYNWTFAASSAILGGYLNFVGDLSLADNLIGQCACISGGEGNTASGENASVSGGNNNTASGTDASVSGGENNKASGDLSFVGGGGGENEADGNEAFAVYSAVLGGYQNLAGDYNQTDHNVGQNACISGGNNNLATGKYASVSGGNSNTAAGKSASVSGGHGRDASNEDDWRAGNLFADY